MPNFDGNGPLRRGRVIGRGRGPCSAGSHEKDDSHRENGQTATENQDLA
jgi:hypothetical protein